MDKEKNQSSTTPEKQEGVGRVSKMHDSNEKDKSTHDISNVDRQEGEMDNGELGGNFKKDNVEK